MHLFRWLACCVGVLTMLSAAHAHADDAQAAKDALHQRLEALTRAGGQAQDRRSRELLLHEFGDAAVGHGTGF